MSSSKTLFLIDINALHVSTTFVSKLRQKEAEPRIYILSSKIKLEYKPAF